MIVNRHLLHGVGRDPAEKREAPGMPAVTMSRLITPYTGEQTYKYCQLYGFLGCSSEDAPADAKRPAHREDGQTALSPVDKDGDVLVRGWTWELRNGYVPIRVQVLDGTDTDDAVRLLRKLADWLAATGTVQPEEHT